MSIQSILWHSRTLYRCRYVTWPIPHSDIYYSTVQEPLQGQSLVTPSQSLVQSLIPKKAYFGWFIGKEGVIFSITLYSGILRIGPEAIWKNWIFSCWPPIKGVTIDLLALSCLIQFKIDHHTLGTTLSFLGRRISEFHRVWNLNSLTA